MRQDLINLYDRYTHGTMPRRDFLKKLALLAGGTAAAAAVLPILENNYALADLIAPDDTRLEAGDQTIELPTGPLGVYSVDAPGVGGTSKGTVIVIHENRGQNPHIRDVARRIALEGFRAVAVDMLSPMGGTPDDADQARSMIYELDAGQVVASLAALTAYLSQTKQGNGKVGAIGFCWGGGMVNSLAAASPALKAGVAYYGRQVDADAARQIKAALMLHYAGIDERINAGIDAYKAALDAAHVDYQAFVYDGVNHAFNNDTNAARYDKTAADLAWGRSMAFLHEKLD